MGLDVPDVRAVINWQHPAAIRTTSKSSAAEDATANPHSPSYSVTAGKRPDYSIGWPKRPPKKSARMLHVSERPLNHDPGQRVVVGERRVCPSGTTPS